LEDSRQDNRQLELLYLIEFEGIYCCSIVLVAFDVIKSLA